MSPRWEPSPPLPEVWKAPRGTLRDRGAEQDEAAGGRRRRRISLGDGRTATASISLKHMPGSRRVYGYLRYSVGGKTITKYVGDATASTREQALRRAWREAHRKGLLAE